MLSPLSNHNSAAKLRALEESARTSGITVRNLPVPFTHNSAEFIFDGFSGKAQDVLFSGFIPDWKVYGQLEQSCQAKGLRLVNSMEQSRQVTEIAHWYDLFEDLTANTVFIEKGQQTFPVLSYPMFIKGKVKSKKEDGWDACLVHNEDELKTISLESDVTVRELLPLKTGLVRADDFPTAHEYRVFVLQNQILGFGYYWGDKDPWGVLTTQEKVRIEELVLEAAQRLRTPFVCVDVGQLQDESWRIVEVGDPQHSGIAHMPHGLFWPQVRALLQ